jgi:serine/threonine-protein kinase
VHRDLKPANVLLARGEQGLVPKVADFGLARLLDDDEGPRHTRSGLAMGTPQYMAPEQFRDAKGVDRRADLFSLGCILHELVSGRPAFPWTDLIGVHGTMMARGWEPLPAGVPDRIRTAIEGCLEPERDARIPDCGTLLAVLDGAGAPRGPTLVPGPGDAGGARPGSTWIDGVAVPPPGTFRSGPTLASGGDADPGGDSARVDILGHPTIGAPPSSAAPSRTAFSPPVDSPSRVDPHGFVPGQPAGTTPDAPTLAMPVPLRSPPPDRAAETGSLTGTWLAPEVPDPRSVDTQGSGPGGGPAGGPARRHAPWIAALTAGIAGVGLVVWLTGTDPAAPTAAPPGSAPSGSAPSGAPAAALDGRVGDPAARGGGALDGGGAPDTVGTGVRPGPDPTRSPTGSPLPTAGTPAPAGAAGSASGSRGAGGTAGTGTAGSATAGSPISTSAHPADPEAAAPSLAARTGTPASVPAPADGAASTPATAPAAPAGASSTRARVRATGALAVWLASASGRAALPAELSAGHYDIWADFGAGPVNVGSVDVAAGDVLLACSERFQTCPAANPRSP